MKNIVKNRIFEFKFCWKRWKIIQKDLSSYDLTSSLIIFNENTEVIWIVADESFGWKSVISSSIGSSFSTLIAFIDSKIKKK